MIQERIDQFADATDDHQWIHVDPERAALGPIGRTIAHEYLTLSVENALLPLLMEVDRCRCPSITARTGYGFPLPCPWARSGAEILAVDEVPGGVQVTFLTTIERQGSEKSCCVAESIIGYLQEVDAS